MFKPLAFAAAVATTAGLLFSVGCDKKTGDPMADLLAKLPTTAPKAAKSPGLVFEQLQYAMLRKDPKHLEVFFIANDPSLALGTSREFHRLAGHYALGLTAEEIDTLGVQDLLSDGYISDQWTSRELKDAMEGKRDVVAGMEKLNEVRLDMPLPSEGMDKKTAEKLNAELKVALEKNLKGAYTSGLYRMLKGIPDEAWPIITVKIGSNPNPKFKDLRDLVLEIEETRIGVITVGHNDDETMFISWVNFEKGPKALSRMFQKSSADGK
jgi:hypothetical protein